MASQTIIINHFHEVPELEYPSIPMVVLYENPSDFPGKFVARLWFLNRPTPYAIIKDTLKELEEEIPHAMIPLNTHFTDDPVIIQTYI